MKYFYFSLLFFVFAACVPKPEVKAPRLYKEDLSLDEIVTRASKDIDALKAITDIQIEKNNEPYDFISASILVKKPGWVHMRIYKFGMLVKDIVIKEDMVHVLTGKNSPKLKQLAREFYNGIFWWDDLAGGFMRVNGEKYIIRTGNKEIQLDRETLLPLQQNIKAMEQNIYLAYDNPMESAGYWYPSRIKIHVGDFTFSVQLKKVIRNPVLGEFDFQTPDDEG